MNRGMQRGTRSRRWCRACREAEIRASRHMLRNLYSRSSLTGILVEHECPRCGREVELPLGALCAECWRNIERRAGKVSRWVAISTTLALAVYVYVRMPDYPMARMVGLSAIVAWYIITSIVTKRVMRELLK